MPSYLAAGLRLEFNIERPEIAFRMTTGIRPPQATLKYEIVDPQIILDTVVLSDAVLRKLSEMSANQSLEWVWQSVHTNSVTTGAASQSSIEVTKALSRANAVWAVPRVATALQEEATGPAVVHTLAEAWRNDSFKWTGVPKNPFTSWQFILGSLHFPLIPVETMLESYFHILSLAKDISTPYGKSSLSYAQFNPILTPSHGEYAAVQTLERSSVLSQSGTAVGAQRGLLVRLTHNLPEADRIVTLFTQHQKLASVFLNQVVVRL